MVAISFTSLEQVAQAAADRKQEVDEARAALIATLEEFGTEAELASVHDLHRFWKPAILKAMDRRKGYTSNFSLWRSRRTDDEYVEALRELLAPEFELTVQEAIGGDYLKVTW